MLRGVYFLLVTVIYNTIRKVFELIGLSFVNDFLYDIYNRIDAYFANWFTTIWDRNLERIATAPMEILSDTLVRPDQNIPIDFQKIGHRQTVTPIECWLTDETIDYSIFFNYYIDPIAAKQALSRLLSKTPIIGGVWVQIDEKQIGIDYTIPCIPFIHAQTDHTPSINPNDFEKPYYYSKYTNGASKYMPFPNGKHVFKITMTHYPKPPQPNEQKEEKEEQSPWNTLIAVGCSHALCDAEALFILLRGWASELRGVGDKEYAIPDFSRHRLLLKPNEIEPFPANKSVLGKHFKHSLLRYGWYVQAIWPTRRWRPQTWIWNKRQINALKQAAFKGKGGARLKEIGRISGNDVLLALHWKLNAVLNGRYEYNRPVLCTMVINTRKWIPERFPKDVNYFGNGLAFLVLHEQRGKLIDMDFSEVVLRVRETVMKLKPCDFEADLSFYSQWIDKNPVKYRHCFQGRWGVGPLKENNYEDVYGGYWHSHYLHDRDMMVSNLMKLDTHSMDMGQGHPSCVRFNHRDEPTMMTYIFKHPSVNNDEFEFYGAFPREYDAFFEKYDIQNAQLNWKEIEEHYVSYPKVRPFFSAYPCMRGCRIYPKRDFCSNRRDKKANFGFVEL